MPPFSDILRDDRGNFGLFTALLAVPLLGFAGLAVDFARATNARDYWQGRADAIALSIASQGPDAEASLLLSAMQDFANKTSIHGEAQIAAVWLNRNDYRVSAQIDIPYTISSVLPGLGTAMKVRAEAVARYHGTRYEYMPPRFADVAPEALDYNRISAYCFSPSTGRGPLVDIADNEGSNFGGVSMPICQAGEVLSYRLMNIEMGRYERNWGEKASRYGRSSENDRFVNGSNGIYYYYTDTTIVDGAEHYDLAGYDVLETILCQSATACRPRSEGGVLPNNSERGREATRQRAAEPCTSGKYMYYGWEDRPAGTRDSDADFDDIRVVIQCPALVVTHSDYATLVR